MNDPRYTLQNRFRETHRYANFGNILTRMEVHGFRLHQATTVEFRSPVTAFCGHNGTGKTTLLQLAACAFRDGEEGYKLPDFFAVGPLDPEPFADDAYISVAVSQPDGRSRHYTLSRRNNRWSDYRLRDERHVLFLGASEFLPRFERKDFTFRYASRLTLGAQTPCAHEISASAAKILGCHYDNLDKTVVSMKRRSDSLLCATRAGLRYSEIHMGFGECRVQNIVNVLECQPDRSLLLLEEPEISLHQAAQFRLGEYLLTLSERKGHQILLSTHSEHLLRALPQASRVLIVRDGAASVQVLPGLASVQAASVMADGHDAALTVIMEDDVAYCILSELLAVLTPHLLLTTQIVIGGYKDDRGQHVGGGKDAICAAMRTLRGAGLRVAAVLDEATASDPPNFVFSLPGLQAPEMEIFGCVDVHAHWNQTYDLDVPAFLAGLQGVDHHHWFQRLARRLSRTRDFVVGEAARIYAQTIQDAARVLVDQLGEAASRK
jgi:predicted ATPase